MNVLPLKRRKSPRFEEQEKLLAFYLDLLKVSKWPPNES